MHMPQLALQHTFPSSQRVVPHLSPLDCFVSLLSGLQNFSMHKPSGSVQIPQLSLQHTCPGLQMFGPHCTSPFDGIEDADGTDDFDGGEESVGSEDGMDDVDGTGDMDGSSLWSSGICRRYRRHLLGFCSFLLFIPRFS